jgi:aminopeptidase N
MCDAPGPMQRPRQFALPGTRPRYAPDRIVDVEHIRLDLELDVERRRLSGTCTTTLAPINDGVRFLELDAVELEITAVRLSGGTQLEHTYDGKRLRIDMGRLRKTGERLTLVVEYAATPRRGLYFVGPDEAYPDRPRQVWSQGQDEDSRYWFPCFDSPNEKSTSEVVATVPAAFFALSNGRLVETRDSPDKLKKTYHWRFDVPHSCYLITLAAGEFVELRDNFEDIDVRYYVPPGREDDARRAMGRTPEMLGLFSTRFGLRYPYEKYAQICVAEFIFGGMENTTATTLTDACLFDERAGLDYDVEALVAHELAHQWFGDLLTCRDWGQGWLNEGFATYSEYIWREHAHGRDEAGLELADWAEQYFGEDSRRYRRPIATNLYDEPIDIFDHHLYEKGGLVLHMLRRTLGEPSFAKAIAHYVKKHRAGSVETRDLARAVEEATGRNVDWFFDQWVQKSGHPELKAEYGWDAEAKMARFTVKQTHKVDADTPLFRLPLEVRFRVGQKDVTVAIEVKEETEIFSFPLEAEPTQAIFDTGQHVLKRLELDKGKMLWLAELAGATEAMDRFAAAKALTKHTSPDVVAALEKALQADPFWGVRAVAAESLGQIRTEAARQALARALPKTKHPKARRAVARALGESLHDETAAAALEKLIVDGDESYFVEAEACLALGKTRSPRAPEALRKALERDSYLDVIRQYAYRGLAAARDESAIPLLVDATRYGKMSQGRRAAIMALAELAQGRRDREARDVRERLEQLLEDPDFRVQQTSIEGLASIGDPRAVAVLQRTVDRELDGRLRRRGREVIRDLQEGRAQSETVKELRDEVDRLRRELTSIRDQIGRLESRNGTRTEAKTAAKNGKATRTAKAKPVAKPVAKKKPASAPRRTKS